MNIKPLKTKTDYKAALREIDSLMPAKPGTPAEIADWDQQFCNAP